MSHEIPKEIKAAVVAKMYEEAAEVRWAQLPTAQRTALYDQWVEAPEIGGRLIQYRETLARVRHWMKDGPMKEYARAVYGVGSYAQFVPDPTIVVTALVEKAMGPEWSADHATQRVKPLNILATNGDDHTRLAWGNGGDQLKHLLWAAIKAEVKGDSTPWILALVETFEAPIPMEEKTQHLLIGDRCGLAIRHVTAGW
jgi:hypothetical protein